MLLGNKCDLEDKRMVSRERGELAAVESGIPFLETSAKTDANVERAFVQLTETILAKTTDDFFDMGRKQNVPLQDQSNVFGPGGMCGCG